MDLGSLSIHDLPNGGEIGKPEPLREDLSGYWSRQIDDSGFISNIGYVKEIEGALGEKSGLLFYRERLIIKSIIIGIYGIIKYLKFKG